MKKLIVLAMVLVMVGMMADRVMAQASTDTGYINLLITPIVTVDLDVSPTYYDFQSVELEQSTCSVSALLLTNIGNVGITLDKAVWSDDVWDITVSSTAMNGFDLWAMAQVAAPNQANYDDSIPNYRFAKTGTGDASYVVLYDRDETAQAEIDPNNTENLWFRLDMPQYVTTEAQQTLNVRLKATSK